MSWINQKNIISRNQSQSDELSHVVKCNISRHSAVNNGNDTVLFKESLFLPDFSHGRSGKNDETT